MADQKKSLTDLLKGGTKLNSGFAAFGTVMAAEDFGVIPPGKYVAVVVDGKKHVARTGTESYKLTFKIFEGEYADRRVWHDYYMTEAAMPYPAPPKPPP